MAMANSQEVSAAADLGARVLRTLPPRQRLTRSIKRGVSRAAQNHGVLDFKQEGKLSNKNDSARSEPVRVKRWGPRKG